MVEDAKHIQLRNVTTKNLKDFEKMMMLYFNEEPVARHFNLTEKDKQIYIRTYMQKLFKLTFGLLLYDINACEVCGIGAVSLPERVIELQDFVKIGGNPSNNMMSMLRFDEYMESILQESLGNLRGLKFEFVYFKPAYRGLKLVDKVAQWVEDVAKRHNCEVVLSIANNNFSRHPGQRNNYLPVKTIYYKDYRDPVTGKAVLAGISPPHTHATALIQKLDKQSKL